MLAFDDLLEPADGVLNLDVLAFQVRELHHDEEGLREEALDLPRPRHRDLVFVRELVNAQDGDDVLEVFILLQDRLHGSRHVVVLFAHDARVEHARGRSQRVHGRIDAELDDLAREHGGRVEVRERCGRSRVGQVVGRNVDRLDGGDRALLGRGDAFLKVAHLRREIRLIAHGGGHPAQQRRHLRARLSEAEDVVNEDEHVAAFDITEIFGHRQGGQAHAQPRAGRLGHLAVDERGFGLFGVAGRDDARVRHFDPQVVPFARALSHARENRNTAVLHRHVVDELLNDHRFPDARAPEQACLPAFQVGLEKVHHLDAGLEHLELG